LVTASWIPLQVTDSQSADADAQRILGSRRVAGGATDAGYFRHGARGVIQAPSSSHTVITFLALFRRRWIVVFALFFAFEVNSRARVARCSLR
jgi:hypothetical protein